MGFVRMDFRGFDDVGLSMPPYGSLVVLIIEARGVEGVSSFVGEVFRNDDFLSGCFDIVAILKENIKSGYYKKGL